MRQNSRQDKMRVIGITGGVGTGKSTILQFLKEEYQAEICQLDEVARQLQRSGTECFKRIVDAFGTGILGADGELDRRKLGELVFSDHSRLALLNAIVHPEVKRWVWKDLEKKRKEKTELYIIESALLPDAGYEEICQEIWYIHVKDSIRMARLEASRGYTKEQTFRMMAAQPPEERFETSCTVRIDNNGPFAHTKEQIGERL